jgi:hypothetical protein
MQLSAFLSAFAAATTVHAWSVEVSTSDGASISEACNTFNSGLNSRSIQKRCVFDGCDDCYDTNAQCRDCNEGSGSLGSCLGWWVKLLHLTFNTVTKIFTASFTAITIVVELYRGFGVCSSTRGRSSPWARLANAALVLSLV